MKNDKSITDRIEKVLEEIRPYLREDEGDIEFVRFEENTNVAEVRFLGKCKTCPMSRMTLRAGIEKFILRSVPEVRRVEEVK